MTAVNNRQDSYDCQWMFDKVGALATRVGVAFKWSFSIVPTGPRETVQTIFFKVVGKAPQWAVSFGQGMVRDVKWLFNDEKTALKGSVRTDTTDAPPPSRRSPVENTDMERNDSMILEKEEVVSPGNYTEARRVAQRVAVAFAVLFVGTVLKSA